MKKIMVLIFMIIFTLITTIAMSADFRGIDWGMTEAEVIEILGEPDDQKIYYEGEKDEYTKFQYFDILLNKEYTICFLRFEKEKGVYEGGYDRKFEYEFEADLFLIPIVNALDNKYGIRKTNDYAWTTPRTTIEASVFEIGLFSYAIITYFDKTYYSIKEPEKDEIGNL